MYRRRIVFVTEYFWPDPVATGRLLGELVNAISEASPNIDVAVVTSNRLYRGHVDRPLPANETRGSVRIRRLRSLRTGNDGLIRRMISDLVFSLQSAFTLWRMNFDTVVAVTNPPIMPMVLSFLPWRRNKRFIYLIHDLHPDAHVAMGEWSDSSFHVRILRWMQGFALRRASKVVVLGRCMRDYVKERYGVDESSIEVIPNWSTVSQSDVDVMSSYEKTTFDVVFGGNLGRVQDFDTILDAAELLLRHPKIRIRIIGDGEQKEWIRQQVEQRALSNVVLSDFVPEREFARILTTASVGLVSLKRGMQGLAVPSKVYNLLAMGLPIVAIVGRDSEVAHIIREAQCGYWVENGDAETLANVLASMSKRPEELAEMAKRGAAYVHNFASLDEIAKKYLALLESKECSA